MEYGIIYKPSTSGNTMSNTILECIHQVLINLVRTCNISETYIEKDESWSGILATAEFAIFSTTNRMIGLSPGQLLFVRNMILLIKHKGDWKLIRQ